jgi:hypothetical protein
MEIMTACHQVKPMDSAMMPNEKDTERYPRPMGMPERNPRKKSFMRKVPYNKYMKYYNAVVGICQGLACVCTTAFAGDH